MNNAQRLIIAFGAVVVALMLLVPPFHEVSGMGRVSESLGYHLIGLAPADSAVKFSALGVKFLAVTILVVCVRLTSGTAGKHDMAASVDNQNS